MKEYKKPWKAESWSTDSLQKGKLKRIYQRISRSKLKKKLQKILNNIGIR